MVMREMLGTGGKGTGPNPSTSNAQTVDADPLHRYNRFYGESEQCQGAIESKRCKNPGCSQQREGWLDTGYIAVVMTSWKKDSNHHTKDDHEEKTASSTSFTKQRRLVRVRVRVRVSI
jgi:hypothetical protein